MTRLIISSAAEHHVFRGFSCCLLQCACVRGLFVCHRRTLASRGLPCSMPEGWGVSCTACFARRVFGACAVACLPCAVFLLAISTPAHECLHACCALAAVCMHTDHSKALRCRRPSFPKAPQACLAARRLQAFCKCARGRCQPQHTRGRCCVLRPAPGVIHSVAWWYCQHA